MLQGSLARSNLESVAVMKVDEHKNDQLPRQTLRRMIRLGGVVEERNWVCLPRWKGGILTKSSRFTHFIVPSVEVAHLSLPIFLLAFMACDSREAVECARGQCSTRLGSEGYRNDQWGRREKVNLCAYVEKGEAYGVGGAWLAEKSVDEATTIFRRRRPHRPHRPPIQGRQPRPRWPSRKLVRRQ